MLKMEKKIAIFFENFKQKYKHKIKRIKKKKNEQPNAIKQK